jgi:hypothetical protein
MVFSSSAFSCVVILYCPSIMFANLFADDSGSDVDVLPPARGRGGGQGRGGGRSRGYTHSAETKAKIAAARNRKRLVQIQEDTARNIVSPAETAIRDTLTASVGDVLYFFLIGPFKRMYIFPTTWHPLENKITIMN